MSNKDAPASDSDVPKNISSPQDNVTPLNYREQFQGRHVTSQFIDPCAAAAKASMDCLDRNDYDRNSCLDYFQAYKDCKKTWINQRKADRRAGRPSV